MTHTSKGLILGAVAIAAALGAGASFADTDTDMNDDPLRCEIRTEVQGRMISLESLVHTDAAISGTYRFKIKSVGGAGKTNISQGSSFVADTKSPAVLGQMMLSSSAVYDAELEVKVGGQTLRCDTRIGGIA